MDEQMPPHHGAVLGDTKIVEDNEISRNNHQSQNSDRIADRRLNMDETNESFIEKVTAILDRMEELVEEVRNIRTKFQEEVSPATVRPLTAVAKNKIRQSRGDVCGVIVRTKTGVAAVSDMGRVTWLSQSVLGPESRDLSDTAVDSRVSSSSKD